MSRADKCAEGRRRGFLAERSLQEIAEMFGVTLQSVQAIEQSALKKLRRHPLMLELAEEYGINLEARDV